MKFHCEFGVFLLSHYNLDYQVHHGLCPYHNCKYCITARVCSFHYMNNIHHFPNDFSQWSQDTNYSPYLNASKISLLLISHPILNVILITAFWTSLPGSFLWPQTKYVKKNPQWLRICLPMQGTRVRALVWEDPTCRGAARPVSHNYWACASGACAPQEERPQ